MSALVQATPEGYKRTELGDIPRDWDTKKLGEVCSLKSGLGITARDINSSNTYPCYGGNGLRGYTKSYTHEGDFALIGRQGALCGNIQYATEKFFASEHALVASPNKDVNAKWLAIYLERMNLNQYSESSAQPGLSAEKLRVLKLIAPLPKEQTAIANALSDVDALLTELEKLVTKKQAIKTATMQQLLTGKTRLPQFATYTDGEKKGQPKGTKPSELGEIPEDWDVHKFGTLFNITAGGDLKKNQFSPIRTDKHPYPIYSNAITNKGLYGYCSTFDYSGEYLTITARGGIGHATERDGSFCAIGRLLVLSPKQNTNCKYVAEFANQYIEFANESTGVPQLTAPQVAKYSVAMPDFEEQITITNILSDMDNEIQALEQRLAKTRQVKQGMMQELLTGRTRLPF